MSTKIFGLSIETFILLTVIILWNFVTPFNIIDDEEENFSNYCGHNYNTQPKKPVEITNNLEEEEIENSDKIKVYNMNAGWCYHSQQFQEEWDKFEIYVKNNKKYKNCIVKDVKCDDSKNYNLCEKKYVVRGYPTVLFIKGDEIFEHNLNRTQDDLVKSLDKVINSS